MSHDLSGRKIAILATDGFEQSELTEPKRALEQAGATTQVISPKSGRIRGWQHTDWGDEVAVDVALEQARPEDYDGLVLPGGQINPDKLRLEPKAVAFVRDFFRAGKPVGAICHGPWMLIEADVVRGRKVTSWRSSGPTSGTPAPSGSIRRWWSTRAWSRAASPTTFRRSTPS
jgi:protease I